jgi:hypothetical protein
MSVLDELKAGAALRRPSAWFFVMPDGLYNDKSEKCPGTKPLAWRLLKVLTTGDTVILLERKGLTGKLLSGKGPELFSLNTAVSAAHEKRYKYYENLHIEDVVDIILGFPSGKNRNIYEKFLEYSIVLLFIESLKNSKIMIGGVWMSRHTGIKGKTQEGYEVFVQNLADRETVVDSVRHALSWYPQYPLEEIGMLKITKLRPYLTDYAIWLENVYLQIRLKNTVQMIYLVLGYSNIDDKVKMDSEMAFMKELLLQYRDYFID